MCIKFYADVAELADALDLGSSAERRVGSSPSIRTTLLLLGCMAKILLISSKAHPDIAAKQLAVAQSELQRRSVKYDLVRVPHPIDILPALSIVFESEDYDGVVACGAIIGDKPNHPIIYQECLRGMHGISLDFASPIGCALLYSHAYEDAMDSVDQVTMEAVISCLEIMDLKKDLQLGDDEQRFRYQN